MALAIILKLRVRVVVDYGNQLVTMALFSVHLVLYVFKLWVLSQKKVTISAKTSEPVTVGGRGWTMSSFWVTKAICSPLLPL